MAEAAKYKKSKAKKNTVKVAFVFWTLGTETFYSTTKRLSSVSLNGV